MINKIQHVLTPMQYVVISLILISSLIIIFAGVVQPQQISAINTSSKYVGGHNYLIFSNISNGSIAVAHDESCFSRSHLK